MLRPLIVAAALFWLATQAAIPATIILAKPGIADCSAGYNIRPGTDNLQAAIAAHPAGTKFCLLAGTYFFNTPVTPKSGDSFIGVFGSTIFEGGKIIPDPWQPFYQNGHIYYRQKGFLPSSPIAPGVGFCQGAFPICTYAEDIFEDNVPLVRQTSIANITDNTGFYEDYPNNYIYLFSNPLSHTIVQSYVSNHIYGGATNNVTFQNIIFQHAASPAQHGALQANASGTSGWLVDHCEFIYNHGAGIELISGTISNSHMHINGEEGFGVQGYSITFTGNEVDHNNYAGFNQGFEAGPGKFFGIVGGTVTSNNVHDDSGHGLWVDGSGYNVTITGNTVTNLAPYAGIVYEISDLATISSNTLTNTGWTTGSSDPVQFYEPPSIWISASANVTVSNNTITTGGNGIGIIQQLRKEFCTQPLTGLTTWPNGDTICPTSPDSRGSHSVANVTVSSNTINDSNASSSLLWLGGMSNDTGVNAYFTGQNIVWSSNTYCAVHPSTGTYFAWKGISTLYDGNYNASQWQGGTINQDAGATFKTYPSC